MKVHGRGILVVGVGAWAVGKAVSQYTQNGTLIALACVLWGVFAGICGVNILSLGEEYWDDED